MSLFLFFEDQQMAWEWIKYRIHEFSVNVSKQIARESRREESELLEKIDRLKTIHESNPSNKTFNNLEKAKVDLDSYEEKKVEGIIVRSRARWHEYGEKSTKYFLNLEKRYHICKHRKLNLSGVITTDPYKILEAEKNYNKILYSSKQLDIDCEESSQFFDNPNIPKLTDEWKKLCEGKVLIEEVTEVLNTFKDKVPGNDGLPADFIKLSGISWVTVW